MEAYPVWDFHSHDENHQPVSQQFTNIVFFFPEFESIFEKIKTSAKVSQLNIDLMQFNK